MGLARDVSVGDNHVEQIAAFFTVLRYNLARRSFRYNMGLLFVIYLLFVRIDGPTHRGSRIVTWSTKCGSFPFAVKLFVV